MDGRHHRPARTIRFPYPSFRGAEKSQWRLTSIGVAGRKIAGIEDNRNQFTLRLAIRQSREPLQPKNRELDLV